MKLSLIVSTSPEKTVTEEPVSVSFGVPAVEASVALLVAPVVETVTALPTKALTHVLASERPAEARVLVQVQVIAVSSALTVSTLPASTVLLPVQTRPDE